MLCIFIYLIDISFFLYFSSILLFNLIISAIYLYFYIGTMVTSSKAKNVFNAIYIYFVTYVIYICKC